MPKTIKIAQVLDHKKLAGAEDHHKKIIKCVLEKVREFKERRSYSEYVPFLNFPKHSRILSESLDFIWEYCSEEDLPLLNMLPVLSDLQIPSYGPEGWYVDVFGTLDFYDEFCGLHARIAEGMLEKNVIIIED